MRLIDIEKLRGCAIIRPHNGVEVKVIESFSDKIKHLMWLMRKYARHWIMRLR